MARRRNKDRRLGHQRRDPGTGQGNRSTKILATGRSHVSVDVTPTGKPEIKKGPPRTERLLHGPGIRRQREKPACRGEKSSKSHVWEGLRIQETRKAHVSQQQKSRLKSGWGTWTGGSFCTGSPRLKRRSASLVIGETETEPRRSLPGRRAGPPGDQELRTRLLRPVNSRRLRDPQPQLCRPHSGRLPPPWSPLRWHPVHLRGR